MSDRVAKCMRVDDVRKFETVDQAAKEANRIREKVKREAEQHGFAVQMLIVISDTDLRTRRRVRPHLHMMLYGSPAETVSRMVTKYINDYQRKHSYKSSATRHRCDVGYIPYIVNQARKIRYYEHDPAGVLSGLNIKAEVLKIDQNAFRKRPAENRGNTKERKGYTHFSELPRNSYGDSRTKVDKGIPKGKKAGDRTGHSTERSLITRDEWLAKSADEKAGYYNSLHMKLSYFAHQMRLNTQQIIRDLECSEYHYDEATREFKTSMQILKEDRELKLYEREMRRKLITL